MRKCSQGSVPSVRGPHARDCDLELRAGGQGGRRERENTVITIQFTCVFFQIDVTSEKSKILSKLNFV